MDREVGEQPFLHEEGDCDSNSLAELERLEAEPQEQPEYNFSVEDRRRRRKISAVASDVT